MKPSIDSYMATQLVTFGPEDEIVYAMRVLLERHLSGAPVVDDAGSLVGLLSKKDCLAIVYRAAYHQDLAGKVGHYMSHEVDCLEADCSILDAADKLLGCSYRRFPVLRDGRLVGLISRHDVLRALDEQYLQNV